MNDIIFSWAEDADGKMIHVDNVPNGLSCNCTCPCCHERLTARHGNSRSHGFAHHSVERGSNLKICYIVTLYKLAEQIILKEKSIRVPSYFGIGSSRDITFTHVTVDGRFDRADKQPDVIGVTQDGEQYIIEFTFDYKVQHKAEVDYKNLNCLEVNLSSQTLESLHDFLLYSNNDKDKKWINNQLYFDQIEELYLRNDKRVKIVDENNCLECSMNTICCGIRNKGSQTPIIIRNNGNSYRVCKVEEYDKLKSQFDKSEFIEESRERLIKNKKTCQFLFGNDFEDNIWANIASAEDTKNKSLDLDALEIEETAKIIPEQRSCFMCKKNLDWRDRGDGYAHCGCYETMKVSKKTHPDAAKTCGGFCVKETLRMLI